MRLKKQISRTLKEICHGIQFDPPVITLMCEVNQIQLLLLGQVMPQNPLLGSAGKRPRNAKLIQQTLQKLNFPIAAHLRNCNHESEVCIDDKRISHKVTIELFKLLRIPDWD